MTTWANYQGCQGSKNVNTQKELSIGLIPLGLILDSSKALVSFHFVYNQFVYHTISSNIHLVS